MDWVDASTRVDFESDNEDDPKKMLAELQRIPQIPPAATLESDNSHDDVKKMLADLNRQTSSGTQANIDDNPRMMLANIKQQARLFDQKLLEEGDDNNLEALHSRLTTMLSHLQGGTAQSYAFSSDNSQISGMNATTYRDDRDIHDKTKVAVSVTPDKKIVPYTVALELEDAGFRWDKVQYWTTYLYSTGPGGYAVQQEKDNMVKRAIDQLEAVIQTCLEEEASYCQSEEKERRLCRLIVSNLAADADEEDIQLFFCRHKFSV